ncbi:glycosyltransferase [Ectothiorhodospira sp. BSL-9]|uniref:glycosyltransferase n=1 Tax=Ectothiorhodospira sp. BSL-9 TaxID=1442136 RepID=UPI0009EF4D78|nr:glycosyltransferase [Ectothiorhodospira sp. BSL-9]
MKKVKISNFLKRKSIVVPFSHQVTRRGDSKGASHKIHLDLKYYRDTYPDLAGLTDQALIQHWHAHGYQEGRFASASHAAGDPQFASEPSTTEPDAPTEVDADFYLTLYPDLKTNGVTTQAQAEAHYRRHGKAEGRTPSLAAWAKIHSLPLSVLPARFSLREILERTAGRGVELDPQVVLDTFLGKNITPLALSDNDHDTHEAYLALAKHHLVKGNPEKGQALLEAALVFEQSTQVLELLGNIYLDRQQYSLALRYYNLAATKPNVHCWVYLHRASCLVKLDRHVEALESLMESRVRFPQFTHQLDRLDDVAEQIWASLYPRCMVYVDMQAREHLVEKVNQYARTLYRTYLPYFGGPASSDPLTIPALPPLGHLNTDKILIIGDYHVPQCVRYRITQKIEQLEAVGKTVTAIDWMELEQHPNALALHDIVIFYRVSAVPKIIKAIAQVNATGKLSLYEIDDLLFDPIYPPPIETYGGYVNLDTYRELTRGMALFNAAARLCRHGIASTEPLRNRLAPLVIEQQCLLHRNGLDHLNRFRTQDNTHKQTIDIFYGSGTQAHNSDFVELALPAVERILSQNSKARLVVVGYLRLPKAFRVRFASQYRQLPPVKSVRGYWSLLEQADINLAVLHEDPINDCKSELKWFEAACLGVPSIVSGTANYRDVIEDGVDAFIASTSEAWYQALKQLIDSPELRRSMARTAVERVQTAYSLKALGDSLVSQLAPMATLTTTRRKVALVNVFFPPQSIGGATRVVADNFKALRKHYHEDLDLCVFTADAECRTSHRMTVYQEQGVRVYRATTLWREHMDWHPKDPEMYKLFSEFLALEQPDMVHFHCVQRLTASIVEAARDAGIPYMVTVHDAWWISDFQFLVDHQGKVYPQGHPDPYEPIELPPGISLAESIQRRHDLKELLHQAHKVLTVSHAFAEIYRQNGIREIEVIPNGISDDVPWAPKDTSYTDRVVCGHVGGMSEHKGYYLLKEAVLTAQPDNLEFLVVDHSKEEAYEQKSYWGKVPVTFIGRVNQDQVVDLYRRIDVLFAPSTWPESFGLVTREAAACGCWVVASDMGGIGEDLVEGITGHVINPTEKALNDVLNKIGQQTKHYKQCIEGPGRATALQQTEQLTKEYMGICRNL